MKVNNVPKDFVETNGVFPDGFDNVDEFSGFDGTPLHEVEPEAKAIPVGLPKGNLIEEPRDKPVFKDIDYNLIEG